MGFYDNVENGIDKMSKQMDAIKEDTEGIKKTQHTAFRLSPSGRKFLNANEYADGKITLDEFIRREKEAEFSITLEEFNALSLNEQQDLATKYPDKIIALLGR